jgi:hypothetical protein
MEVSPTRLSVVIRALVLLAAVTLLTGLLGRLAVDPLRPLVEQGGQALRTLAFPQALDSLAAATLIGCWLRVALAAVLLTLRLVGAALRGRGSVALGPVAVGRTPRLVRRAVLLALGLGLPAALSVPAHADGACRPAPQAFGSRVAALAGLPLPDRTVGVTRPVRAVTVRPGDSLWSIADRLAPPAARTPAVAATWHGLLEANRAVLGADPDLIFPGDHLVVPVRDRSGKEQP